MELPTRRSVTSDDATIFEPTVNRNFIWGFYRNIVNHRLGDNGP
jgi:hypothetical protein